MLEKNISLRRRLARSEAERAGRFYFRFAKPMLFMGSARNARLMNEEKRFASHC
jgi:hypothetical protein